MKHSLLEELEEAKAKQDSLRERLAAKRQQRRNLLDGIRSSTIRATSRKLLPGTGAPAVARITSSSGAPTSSLSSNLDASRSRVDVTASPLAENSTHCDPADLSTDSPVKASVPEVKSVSGSDGIDDVASLNKSQNSASTSSIADETYEEDNTRTSSSKATVATDGGDTVQSHSSCADSTSRFPDAIKTTGSEKAQSPAAAPTLTVARQDAFSLQTELEDLLGAQTAREKENKRIQEEILTLLNTPTTKERFLSEKFRSQGGSQVQQFCAQGTRIECTKYKARTGNHERCTKLHFRKIIHPHTDESLGDCSFLNTCFHVDTCKYVHYAIDYSDEVSGKSTTQGIGSTQQQQSQTGASQPMDETETATENEAPVTLYPPQWINCDIRLLNMSILGKFAVIMADPPWDIHMELPYGTMSDDEMRRLDIPCLQDDGYIFLWVTGRAMELGRDCLRLWGYQRVDEIIWVKTNQLQRLIRTGRTGHWLNHGKEHCLVGVKGKPQRVNRGLDCDVIVSEVRETSHKPDEIYGLIERLSPGTRKLELFGRPHNLQPNWITLGNQLDGTYLVDPVVVERFKKHYPNGLDSRSK